MAGRPDSDHTGADPTAGDQAGSDSAVDQDAEPVDQIGQLSSALRALLRAGRDMHSVVAGRLGVGDTDLTALDELARSGGALGPVELGQRLGIRSASATVLVDRLQARGHLERRPHPVDRRRVSLHPTASALVELREVLNPIIESMDRIGANLSAEQVRTIQLFLTDVTTAIRRYTGDDPGGRPPAAD